MESTVTRGSPQRPRRVGGLNLIGQQLLSLLLIGWLLPSLTSLILIGCYVLLNRT